MVKIIPGEVLEEFVSLSMDDKVILEYATYYQECSGEPLNICYNLAYKLLKCRPLELPNYLDQEFKILDSINYSLYPCDLK
jgi:hypothetical protein